MLGDMLLLTGTPESAGSYELDLTAMVTVNLASVGLDADLSFPIPYNGENAILNTVLGTDYSALNSFVPTFTINVEPEAGFYPPEGSVFNSDSSVVTLPEASTESDYNESISFYATEEISIPDVGSFGFVSANITSVSTPAGMSYSCDPEGCNFGPNAWGYVTLNWYSRKCRIIRFRFICNGYG